MYYINYELNYFNDISKKGFFVRFCDETANIKLGRFCSHNEDKYLDYIIIIVQIIYIIFKNLLVVRVFGKKI